MATGSAGEERGAAAWWERSRRPPRRSRRIGRTRPPRQHEARRDGLALLTATVPDVRRADLAASPPRAAERPDTRHQRISRLSGDGPVEADAVMAPYGRELLARLAADGRTVVPMIDRTRAAGRRRAVAVAARAGAPCRRL